MDIWMKVTGSALAALFTLFIALVATKPRVCFRIAQLIGGYAVAAACGGLMGVIGAYQARAAVMKQAAELYAITDGTSTGDSFHRDTLAAAIDPVIGQALGWTTFSGCIAALCVGAIYVARLVMSDEIESGSKQLTDRNEG